MIDPLPGDIFHTGQVLNNTYEIEGVIGRGGTGEVYLARNQITGRVVAVKALNRAFSAKDAYIELMKREEEMRNINSDAIVRYTDCSRSAEGHVYLVMDYVDGTPLSELLERGGTKPRDLMVVAHRVAEGLVTAHGRKIVHRDLSPDNIILRGGDPAQAVIIDFGIAKDASAGARTIVGNDFAGKYEYAAPEQMHGRAEPRSDLYALGASLLATFRGQVPDLGRSPGAVIARKEQPLDTAGVPEPLRGLIDALTQPDPARRPPSAAAVVGEIEGLLKPAASKPGTKGGAKAGTKPGERPVRRRRWPLGVAALVLVAALVAAGWLTGMLPSLPGSQPTAAPFVLAAERGDGGAASLAGDAPDAAARGAIIDAFAAATGATPGPQALGLARGAPFEGWGSAAASLIALATPLEAWRLELSDRDATLTGVARDAAARDAASRNFTATAASAGFTPHATVAAGPLHLDVAALRAALAPQEDCGPLAVAAPPGGSFPLGATVAVSGTVASEASVGRIRDALAAAIGDRSPQADLVPMTPALCGVAGIMPAAPGAPPEIALATGATGAPNPGGLYRAGEIMVIDVLLPGEPSNGYLWVTLVDGTPNTDMAYHLLPNPYRPDAAVASNPVGPDGMRRVRVAFPQSEAAPKQGRFVVGVGPPYGGILMTVFVTDRPLFDPIRPVSESIESFREGLAQVLAKGDVKVLSVATRLIKTEE